MEHDLTDEKSQEAIVVSELIIILSAFLVGLLIGTKIWHALCVGYYAPNGYFDDYTGGDCDE